MRTISYAIIDEVNNTLNMKIIGDKLQSIILRDCSNTVLTTITVPEDSYETTYINNYPLTGINTNSLIFIEFNFLDTEEDCCGNSGTSLKGLVANFAPYHECLLNKVLKLDIKGCGTSNSDCEPCHEDVYYIQALLSALYSSVKFRQYNISCKILDKLDTLCDLCCDCTKYSDSNALSNNSDFFKPIDQFLEDSDMNCINSDETGCIIENMINFGNGYGFATLTNVITIV